MPARLTPRRLLKGLRLLRLFATRQVTVGDRRYRIALPLRRDSLVFAATGISSYESALTTAFYEVLRRRSGAVMDVGANSGQTMLKLLSIDPSRRYIGVEPQSSCCTDIQAFIHRNKLANHDIVCCGISSAAGLATLSFGVPNDVRASLVSEFRPPDVLTRKTTVPVVTGDELLDAFELEDVALIKIDVEGGELEVLQGLQETLRTRRPFIALEVLPNRLVHSGAPLDKRTRQVRAKRYGAMQELLTVAGYEISLIGEGGRLTAADFEPDEHGAVRNYIADPGRQSER
jgi:FkbM family methyltransferase